MSEIKFRIWNKRNSPTQGMGQAFKLIDSLNQELKVNNKDDLILMQYTGLKDKNGREIYEGDILNVLGHIYKVRWYDYDEKAFDTNGTSTNYPERAPAVGFGFEYLYPVPHMEKYFDHKDFKLCYFEERTEVIGNIYENPELAKGKI